MRGMTVHTGVSDWSAESNISTQTQNQRSRAIILGANIPGPPLDQFLLDWNANSVPEFFRQPQALFCAKDEAISRLKALVVEYAIDGTIKIHPDAVATAKCFLRALPDGVSLPEFSIEPDGSISLDWIESRNCLFSLSVGKFDRVAYAYLDGVNKGHAVESFDGQHIPQRILDGIKSIVSHGNAFFRAA